MRVGILGGTFDPIHLGHLLAAERVREEEQLDEIWFMPSHIPPHKTHLPHASAEQRWAMLLMATAPHPHFRPIDTHT
jgi:nicotinate-nucleotide adenylyltransferase